MVYRCLGHYFALVRVELGVMIVDAGNMIEQVTFLIGHIETNFIPTEVEIAGSIVILLAFAWNGLAYRSRPGVAFGHDISWRYGEIEKGYHAHVRGSILEPRAILS